MVASLTKYMCLALLFLTTATQARHCANPRVRREWRSISEAEREEWVAAVKVEINNPDLLTSDPLIPLQCLNKVPHKSSLKPTFDLAITQIPPVNPNSSYFDGAANLLL